MTNDADIALIADYFAGELTEAESEQVEDRLAFDAAFYEKVAPVIGMQTSGLDYRRVLREVEEGGKVRRVPHARSVRRARLGRVLLAASLAMILGASGCAGYAYATGAAEAAAIVALQPEASGARAGTYVLVPPGQRQHIDLEGGSRLRLEPQSRVTYRRRTQWPGGYLVTLRGEALVNVSDADGVMFVATMKGTAILLPGTYGIRCRLACETIEVSVGARGVAWLRSDTRDWTYWPVQAFGHVEHRSGIGWMKTEGINYPPTH